MKQKDLSLILVMVFIAAVSSFVLSRWIFSSPQNRKQTAEKVDVIGPEFTALSRKHFNAESINPTQQIEIGGSSNPNPFNAKPQ